MKKVYFLVLTGLLSSLFFSCDNSNDSKKDDNNGNSSNSSYVNQWIFDEMSLYYLWNNSLPSKLSLSFESNPEDFFSSLLYKKDQRDGDRFSWIQENYVDLLNSLSGKSSLDIGFEYVGYLESQGSSNVVAQVAYVKPRTNAETLGIKRGDLFNKVDGTQLTTSNWRSLFNSNSATVTFIKPGGTTEDKNITLTINYSEDPIYLDTIYIDGANKIGYLVYNFFAADDGGSNKYAYDIKLNEVFGRFKDARITHLVLDFRYNSGGLMSSATLLGSMIVPNLDINKVFTKRQYNALINQDLIRADGNDALVDKFKNVVKTGTTSSIPLNNIGNNLQELYVLTSSWTASASELVINNLKPYFPNIKIIGNTTVGKNVGSTSLYEENDPKNKWGMQPIILKYTDVNGNADFSDGMVPNVVNLDNGEKIDLGEKNEVLLNIALSMINGTYSPSSVSQQAAGVSLQPIGSSVEKKAWANHVIVDLEKLKAKE